MKLLLPLLLLSAAGYAQITFPNPAPSDERSGFYALTNATVFVSFENRIDSATLLIRDGQVMAVGRRIPIPPGAAIEDLNGQYIYPTFIDLYAGNFGLAASPSPPQREGRQAPHPQSSKTGAFSWNEALQPEYHAAQYFSFPASDPAKGLNPMAEWHRAGFGAVVTHRADGIARGTGALVLLGGERIHEALVREKAASFFSLRKGSSKQDYPASLMGVIALLRQTYIDALWYQQGGQNKEKNLSLEAWLANQQLPQIFEASDKLDILRIARIGKEFDISFLIKTNGDEYQRLEEVKSTGAGLIVPLNFPEAFDIRDAFEGLEVPLRDLKHWEMALANPSFVQSAGIPFALTSAGLRDKNKFLENLRKAVEYGLSETDALKALTYQPAKFIGLADKIGALKPGLYANFFIATGNIFDKSSKIRQTWVNGKPNDLAPNRPLLPIAGAYRLEIGRDAYGLTIKEKEEIPETYLTRPDSSRVQANLSYSNGLISLSFALDSAKSQTIFLSGVVGHSDWSGQVQLPDGTWASWRARRDTALMQNKPEKPATARTKSSVSLADRLFPFTAFGRAQLPKAGQSYLVRNATVWTSESDGILQNTDVLFENGKIIRIGKALAAPPEAIVIDGTGKHLTAGIIDEHSHIAISRSVNEGTQESSAEVRIGDVLDSEDIDLYRQLAGGVTSSHLLHGSANPIGGQTQLIKLRWGASPEQLKFEGWAGQIKFALGENVKQSNWGDQFRTRYPQTRMGVEQVFVDYFTRAQEYIDRKSTGKPFRKDLELEALAEILLEKRFITCHSYVQSEIVMLMRLAEHFDFKINTFTHILEGYKVAGKMAKHGVGGSTFSDWWAYKFEVYEAIPYNAKMMHDRGVVVAINSDDAEMARRLNQEAGKTVLYGGVPEVEAWKMVTINPAKLLHVDERVGSIKPGKDADLVLWSAHPLSVYSRVERTWVDGILQYDLEEDARLRQMVTRERARLIQKMLAAPKSENTQTPGRNSGKKHYHCDSDEDEG